MAATARLLAAGKLAVGVFAVTSDVVGLPAAAVTAAAVDTSAAASDPKPGIAAIASYAEHVVVPVACPSYSASGMTDRGIAGVVAAEVAAAAMSAADGYAVAATAYGHSPDIRHQHRRP